MIFQFLQKLIIAEPFVNTGLWYYSYPFPPNTLLAQRAVLEEIARKKGTKITKEYEAENWPDMPYDTRPGSFQVPYFSRSGRETDREILRCSEKRNTLSISL